MAPRNNKDAQEDLASLAVVSEDAIVAQLQDRWSRDQVYTRIGADVLVAVNPVKAVASSTDDTCKQYANSAKDTNLDKAALPPHVFEMAASAYYHMLRTKTDQSLVLTGESGSGKSEVRQLFVRQLCALSKREKKKTKVHSGVLKLEKVLEAFGNARTTVNANSSRFGKYTEYQFDNSGKMIGAKVLDYLLEKTRVTKVPADERNFHSFYYLLAGASHEEKQKWHLHDPSHFNYLSQNKMFKSVASEDSAKFVELREYLKSVGVGRRQQAQIFQLLAAILHLGNITFLDDPHNANEACTVKNYDTLDLVAEFLGIDSRSLESVLTYKTKLIKKELCTVLLNAEGAAAQRDSLAQTLYSLLFSWLVEHVNTRLCKEDCANFIGVADFSGFQNLKKNGYETFLTNFANEKVRSLMNAQLFDAQEQVYSSEGMPFAAASYSDNRAVIDMLADKENGVFAILDAESAKGRTKNPDNKMTERIYESHGRSAGFSAAKKASHAFGVQHFAGAVEYDTKGFIEKNLDTLSIDFVTLFRGTNELPSTSSIFLRGLFSDKVVSTQCSANNVLVAAQQSHKPLRKPSMKGKNGAAEDEQIDTCASQFVASIEELFATLQETRSWFVCCVKPNENVSSTNKWDSKSVVAQVKSLGLVSLAQRAKSMPYGTSHSFEEFLQFFDPVLDSLNVDSFATPRNKIETFIGLSGYNNGDIILGNSRVFLSESAWRSLNDEMRVIEKTMDVSGAGADAGKSLNSGSVVSYNSQEPGYKRHARRDSRGSYFDDNASYYSENDNEYYEDEASVYDDNESHYDSEYKYDGRSNSQTTLNAGAYKDLEMGKLAVAGGLAGANGKGVDGVAVEEPPVKPLSKARRKWLCCTWCLTWWVPTCCISLCGMKRKDIQMAWREKLALCLIIAIVCGSLLFFIVGLGRIICPPLKVMTLGEISQFKDINEPYVAAYGRYFKINEIVNNHLKTYVDFPAYFDDKQFGVLGSDVSDMFYKASDASRFNRYCPDLPAPDGAWDNIAVRSDQQFRYPHTDKNKDYLGYLNKFAKGRIGWTPTEVQKQAGQERKVIIIYDNVYDMSAYATANPKFLGTDIDKLISQRVGQDASAGFDMIRQYDPKWQSYLNCMNQMFYIGTVDHRGDFKCVFSNVLLLSASILIVAVIGFKFFAALQLTSRRDPEEHDKFVICQVPCYTEGPESLTKTLESLAMLRYDDKRKLLCIIADGMIIGSGNDRPTPRIVLDILGVDASIDPEPLSFQSLGEGNKQLNMGKVYSGLYEVQGHAVPFIVVIKVGKQTERSRPGNRGKRDSQMIMMNFLNKVHFNREMNPLELELYHQLKNVIGVNPSFYEYVLNIDADTEVYPDSLNRMISCMIHDSKIMGICGETLLSNEKDSWVTMIQVYEYFISHHLAKAFESLFGSVTCLPGCFCMYRVRTPTKNIPLLIAPGIVADYAENEVDTLHKKNLLALGEDRYLTTLMMKHFPQMRLVFTPDAQCRTNAPDRWSVLLSQRRRWINSTVHNLLELLFLPQLCGFCCFSMRFVVFLDLFSTVVQPAAVLYLVYLVYTLIFEDYTFPLISIILLAAIYGLQVLIFIIKRQWQHIGWMIIYMLAIPVFSFYIPLYSFWHFDDFSWGNTRVVADGKKGNKYLADTEPFDPKSIPMKKWSDYEQELWEKQSVASRDSRVSDFSERSGVSNASRYSGVGAPRPYRAGGSVYGGSVYGAPAPVPPAYNSASRPGSVAYGSSYGAVGRMTPAQAPGMPGYDATGRPMSMSNMTQVTGYSGAFPTGPVNGSVTSGVVSVPASNGMNAGGALPADEEILKEVRHILSTANLMTITKKQVRDELATFFGTDLTSKKEYINQCIDGILQGRL